MIVRGWHIVLPLTVVVWLVANGGYAVLTFIFGWWLSFVFFGGLRHGIVVRGVRNPLRGFGEEQAPGVEEGPRAP